MRLISCASYYGSGSSAFTDLIAEYRGVKSMTDYEFRFVHDLDGILDLEYHLVDCHNRHNSGHALKRYRHLCEFNHGSGIIQRYEPFFNGHFLDISMDYIHELTDFEYAGKWFYDMYDRGTFYYYYKSLLSKVYSCLSIHRSSMPKEKTICSHPSREKFLDCTRRYIDRLLEAANPEHMPVLMMDQILPSSNINKCLRYFPDDTKLVIVTRDPRDVYFSDKYIWHGDIVPSDPVVFCKWFDYIRRSNGDEIPDPQKVMTVNFEDLIYNYKNTVSELESFLGLKEGEHVKPFECFNPKRSFFNTQLWKKFENNESLRVIEEALPEYLYDFGNMSEDDVPGITVRDITLF